MNKEKIREGLGIVVVLIALAGLVIAGQTPNRRAAVNLTMAIWPPAGVVLPVIWGDLSRQLIVAGVINEEKIGVLTDPIRLTEASANLVLNSFWALGLANKNSILTAGPMMTNGDPANFASTGGWPAATGQAMDHYAKHKLVILTPEQQALVERVSKNIYRPCCNNPTHFPDCNHGLAMLGLLELGASQDLTEKELYRLALTANSYWFPDAYLALAEHFERQGVAWSEVDPKIILGADYSSASGFAKIKEKSLRAKRGLGASCGL